MQTTFDNPETVPAPAGRYSHVARLEFGGGALLMLSGQAAVDATGNVVAPGDMAAQTAYVFELVGAILHAHGAEFSDVVNIRTYLTDIGRLAEYAQVRRGFLPAGVAPTSTTVEVSRLFKPDALVEVEVTAAVATSRADTS
jgi:2-iminobutanoate/2-iminopropanoate deaminase